MTFFRLMPSTALVVAMASMAAPVAGPANAAELTTYATFSYTRPGNIKITPDGRVIISGDVEASAIGIASPEGYEVVAQDDTLLS